MDEMEKNHGMMDLAMNGSWPLFPAMMMLGGRGGDDTGGGYGGCGSSVPFGSDSGLSGDSGSGGGGGGGDGGSGDTEIGGGRWPKEETLALLDIRARLDSMFKEANHKGPLWEEVSKIMYLEHGYKRTGKKCSEKFENLYKYYKKIKEGKAGRQDNKHYRFFHQLEAISGERISNTKTNTNPISVTSAEDNHLSKKTSNTKMLEKKRWKTTITELIEKKMNTLMEKQDKWMEKVMNTIEEKEKERISKEKEWRREEAARIERAKSFRSNERAKMEHRDAALMEALHELTKIEQGVSRVSSTEWFPGYETTRYTNQTQFGFDFGQNESQIVTGWGEDEITQLIQLRSSMETRFDQGGIVEDVLWEEIASTMASLGYIRSALICKAKWDHVNFLLRNKKQKGCSNVYSDHYNHNFHDQAGERFVAFDDQQRNGGNTVFMNDSEMMWNYYGRFKET